MKNLSITLSDGTFNGTVTMQSSSKIHVVKTAKKLDPNYSQDLEEPGLYFLLVGNNSVYVGQSGLNEVEKRIMEKHSGEIDSQWHTVVGFMCSDKTITVNELLYMENALCEYVHKSDFNCLTKTPSKKICNAKYRNKNYHLSSNQINICNNYIEDIKHYLSFLKKTMFNGVGGDSQPARVPSGNKIRVYYKCTGSGAVARGYHTNTGFKVCENSLVSDIKKSFEVYEKSHYSLRKHLESQGIIKNNKFTKDYEFKSLATASNVILGRSSSAPREWKIEE